MGIRFEFDDVNQIVLARIDGQLTDESLRDAYRAIRRYSVVTDAKAGIFDLTGVTEFAVSSEFVRGLALSEPAMPKADERPRVVIAPPDPCFRPCSHVPDYR